MKVKNIQLILALSVLFAISGCGWFGGDKNEAGPAIPSMPGVAVDIPKGALAVWGDGKPMVTQKEFDERLDVIMKKPELKGVSEQLLPMLKAQLFTGLVFTKIIDKWVKENKIDKLPEYKKMLDQLLDEVKIHVNTSFFSKELDVEPSDADIKKYYEENKDRIALISRGGVKAMGVKFGDEKAALAFLEKAKEKGANFVKLVDADAKLKENMQDFNLVNKQSRGIDKILVEKILEMKKFPTVEMIKVGDKNVWVIKATEREKEAYKPYKEVKETIYAIVKQTKQNEVTQKKLDELKAKYGVKIKENAFMPPQPKKLPVMPPAPQKGKKVAEAEESKPIEPATKTA